MLPVLAIGGQSAMADDATVKMTDQGFDPPTLSIQRGGTVTWVNNGSKVHSATSKTAAVPFDIGGVGPGQAVSLNFTMAGTYAYTSAIDCGNAGGNPSTTFNCGTLAIISVTDPVAAYNPNAFNVQPTATPTPVLAGPPQNAVVHISKAGFSPSPVTVALGGSVTFINDDNGGVHNATTFGGGNAQSFDTGGMTPGILSSIGFSIPGTYTYTSAVDCLSSVTPGFNCSPAQIVVSTQPSALAPTASGAVVAASSSTGTNVTIDDSQGFGPKVLVVRVGDTVTWTNNGKNVHTVASDAGYQPQFDSGGMDAGKTFSMKFASAGSYGYHSTTETNYAIDGMGNQVVQWGMTGTIIAQ